MLSKKIPTISGDIECYELRKCYSGNIFLRIVFKLNRETYSGGMAFIEGVKKPKYSSGNKAEHYRFPVGAVKLKEINKDPKEIQCSKAY